MEDATLLVQMDGRGYPRKVRRRRSVSRNLDSGRVYSTIGRGERCFSPVIGTSPNTLRSCQDPSQSTCTVPVKVYLLDYGVVL